MKKLFLLLPLILLAVGCTTAPKDTLTQVSTIDALLAGVYDGQMTLGELKKHGDFGIGTFDALEGEMIILDGTVYQARADGTVLKMPNSAATPFAAVVHFQADQTRNIRELDFAELKAKIDHLAPNKNIFTAVRIDGTFSTMKARSVPKQNKPYPPLADVITHQTVFEWNDISGTLLGFRCPAFVKGINVPDYHLHFISKDRKYGGHILNVSLQEATLQLDLCNQFHLVLTDREDFSRLDLSQDRSHQLERVEQ